MRRNLCLYMGALFFFWKIITRIQSMESIHHIRIWDPQTFLSPSTTAVGVPICHYVCEPPYRLSVSPLSMIGGLGASDPVFALAPLGCPVLPCYSVPMPSILLALPHRRRSPLCPGTFRLSSSLQLLSPPSCCHSSIPLRLPHLVLLS